MLYSKHTSGHWAENEFFSAQSLVLITGQAALVHGICKVCEEGCMTDGYPLNLSCLVFSEMFFIKRTPP